MKLKPYPEYKDSGLPWLGEIPAHWAINPGFSAFREKQYRNSGMSETTVLSLSYGRIVVKPPEKLHGLVPASFETYQVVYPNDIIIRPTDLQNDWNSLRVGISRNRGIITSAYLCLKTIGPLSPDYGYLLLHTYDLMKIFYGMGSGLRQNLDFTDLKRMPVVIPPQDEQDAIAAFLAHADRRINRLIRAKRRLIELLHEQKQAIINQAVTRGLDPNVRLKPSDIDWLGDVPGHWEIIPLRWYLAICSGDFIEANSTSTQQSVERPYPVIGGNGVFAYTDKVNDCGTEIVVGRVGALCGNVHVVYEPAWITDNALRLTSAHQLNPEYLALQLRSMDLNRLANANAQPLITAGVIKAQKALLPPQDEQSRIVEHCNKLSQDFDTIIGQTQREINLIREYHTRLIADVVTGKVDVRNVKCEERGVKEGDEDRWDEIGDTGDNEEPIDAESNIGETDREVEEV